MTNPTDQVRFDILIEAQASLKSLQMLLRATESNERKIIEFSRVVLDASRAWGVSWQQALNVYRQLNAELSKNKKSTVFGNVGGKDLFQASSQYIQGLEQAKRVQGEVATGAEQLGQKAESGILRAVSAVNLLRIALGTLTAMLLFSVIQAFQNMVRGAMKGLSEIEAAMFNVVNAEKRLSEQGIEITVEGLQQLIEDLQKLDPMLSKFQATELISALTTKVAPALGLGEKEVESLSKSITILSVRNQALGKSFEEVESQVITGLLSGKVTAGINQLGVKITDQIVQEEALRLGLVATSEAYSNLNAKEQERINALSIISILEKNTAQEVESLPEFLQTASGLIGVAKAEFQDLLTTIGQKAAPAIKEIFKGIIQFLEKINRSLEEDEDAWNSFFSILTIGAKAVLALANAFLELGIRIGEAGRRAAEAAQRIPIFGALVKHLFPEQEFSDTPTGVAPSAFNSSEAEASGEKYTEAIKKSEEDVQDAMQDARDKRLDIERDYQRKLEDINTDLAHKMQDLATDTARKREDALRDYTQKVEDIERDTNQAIQEAQEDARKKEEDAEAEHQQRLKELRQKFLFDLEDALHERDARQVLRLIRQYKFDKQNLEERHKLQKEESKQNLQVKIEELQQEKQLKLEAARREYEEKLADIAIGEKREKAEISLWKSRQLQDARTWHNRQLQENREYLQRKLRDIAEALAAELQMNQAAAQGLVSTWASAYSALGSNVQQIGNVLMGSAGSQVIGSGAVTQWNGGDWGGYSPGNVSNIPGFAEGGTLIATKPTKAIFGEDGPERVDFTPIGRAGKNTGRVFGGEGAGGMGGTIDVMLTLSPDLEARIVDTSLENVALHFERLDRSK